MKIEMSFASIQNNTTLKLEDCTFTTASSFASIQNNTTLKLL